MPNTNSIKPKSISNNQKYFIVLFMGIFIPLIFLIDIILQVIELGRLNLDVLLLLNIHQYATPTLDKIAVTLTNFGSPLSMSVLALIILTQLFYLKKYCEAVFFTLAVGGAALINLIIKLALHRARPELWTRLVVETDFSLPSGHAMGSMALFLAILVLLWPTKWRYFTLAIGLVFVSIIGLTRLYLGVHYPSDILAGWLASIIWVCIVYLSFQTLLSSKRTK